MIVEHYNEKGMADRMWVEGECERQNIDKGHDIIDKLITKGVLSEPRMGWLVKV
jgi:hypothetical protein